VSGEGGANEHILVVGFARDAVGHAETFARVPRHRLATSLSTTQDACARVEHEAVWLHHTSPHTSSHYTQSVQSISRRFSVDLKPLFHYAS